MTLASPRPSHCSTCSCGPRLPVLTQSRLMLRAIEYVASLGSSGNIDGDPGGIDAEYIAEFRDAIPLALSSMGYTVRPTYERGRMILAVTRQQDEES